MVFRYYYPVAAMCGSIIPAFVAVYLWGENPYVSMSVMYFRYILGLHNTGFINSVAHYWGVKPYNYKISARESLIVSEVLCSSVEQHAGP